MAAPFEVAHHVPGRLRLRLVGDSVQHAAISDAVRGLPYVRKVEVRAPTGSVVVDYAPSAFREVLALIERLAPGAGRVGAGATPVETKAERASERPYSAVAHTLLDTLGAADRELRRATRGQFDLRLLFPLGVALYGLTRGRRPAPPWVHLGLLATGLFTALHQPTRRGEPPAS